MLVFQQRALAKLPSFFPNEGFFPGKASCAYYFAQVSSAASAPLGFIFLSHSCDFPDKL